MQGRPRVPAGAQASLRLRVRPDARYGGYVRERVARFAASHRVPERDAEEFVTAVNEALANAVEHARTAHAIEIGCTLVGEQLVATVVDRGVGFDTRALAAAPRLPDGFTERGRGLPIMQRYTDTFSIDSAPGKGTSVVLGRFVRAFN